MNIRLKWNMDVLKASIKIQNFQNPKLAGDYSYFKRDPCFIKKKEIHHSIPFKRPLIELSFRWFQWASNFSMYQNHLEDTVNTGCSAPAPSRISDSEYLRCVPQIWISDKFSSEVDDATKLKTW